MEKIYVPFAMNSVQTLPLNYTLAMQISDHLIFPLPMQLYAYTII